MSETSNPPVPGWYADPQIAGNLRYWDGSAWTDRSRGDSTAPRPLEKSFDNLAALVRFGLILSLATLAAETALYLWGLSMLGDAIAAGNLDRLASFDSVNQTLTIIEGVTYLVTGVSWVCWQYTLARSLPPGELARTPGMHAGSWFIPVANFVLPFQNMRSLWRALVSPSSGIISAWWAILVIANVAFRVAAPGNNAVGGLDHVNRIVSWWLASSLLGIVAAVLALRIVRALTRAAKARPSILSAAATPDA